MCQFHFNVHILIPTACIAPIVYLMDLSWKEHLWWTHAWLNVRYASVCVSGACVGPIVKEIEMKDVVM
jgi:hypothetical protein